MTLMRLMKPLPIALATVLLMVGSTPAQQCDPNITATAPDSRYTDHGDGTVTDNITGLMWKQCAEGLSGAGCKSGIVQYLTWQGALQRAQGLTFAGNSDWRLPNIKELASLVEDRCMFPTININIFPSVLSGEYWSSSPDTMHSYNAWVVNFYTGDVNNDYLRNREVGKAVRLVREGQ